MATKEKPHKNNSLIFKICWVLYEDKLFELKYDLKYKMTRIYFIQVVDIYLKYIFLK